MTRQIMLGHRWMLCAAVRFPDACRDAEAQTEAALLGHRWMLCFVLFCGSLMSVEIQEHSTLTD